MHVNSSSSSLHHLLMSCMECTTTVVISSAVLLTNIFLLIPLLFYMFYLGFKRWRKQRSSSSSSVLSHTDFFTYNVAALELISILGTCFCYVGTFVNGLNLQWLGNSVFHIAAPGQSLFHLLTCVERYLAVVHPVTYLGLKQAGGVKLRNILAGFVWLLGLLTTSLSIFVSGIILTVTNSTIMICSLILVSFCSFSVLRVLKHPGPGEVSGDRERVDQSKQRAFHTILIIMLAQMFRLAGMLVSSVMFDSLVLSEVNCVVGASSVWVAVPCGLVLPLLFLQKAGKLGCCKHGRSG